MAQTKKKRKRKHRGTQGGSVSRAPQRRPRNREEAKAQARSRSTQPRSVAPSWGSAINRALFGAVIFFVLMLLLFKRSAGEAFGLAALMAALYVPMGYYLDRFFYRRRLAKEQQARALAKQQHQGRR